MGLSYRQPTGNAIICTLMIYSKQNFPKINPPNQKPQHVCLQNICTKFTLQNRRKSIERAINKSKGSRNQKKVLENRYDTMRYAMFVWASSLFMALFFVFYGFALVHLISGAGRGRERGRVPSSIELHATCSKQTQVHAPLPPSHFPFKTFLASTSIRSSSFLGAPGCGWHPYPPIPISVLSFKRNLCNSLIFYDFDALEMRKRRITAQKAKKKKINK